MPSPHPTDATGGTRLILASASPRRALILRDLGIPFEVHLPHCAERAIADAPAATVGENARQKALSVRKRYPGAAIIAADTVVAFQGQILGKPKDYAQAQAWLLSYAGKRQAVYTAVALMTPHAMDPSLRIEVTSLRFKDYGALVAQEYLDRVQPFDRAGAYDINALGEMLIAERVGSYTNVMGLPRDVVADWFNAHFSSRSR
ncbi:MAG: Maf family protein [Candidatus Spyradenecus sp.]